MDQQQITLVTFGYFEKGFLEKIAEAIRSEFQISVKIREAHIDLSEFYDPGRRQYNGNSLLKKVDSMIFPDSVKIIGLFSVDLFIPILTFIFGQAVLRGHTGIASMYRLNNELYGMPVDKNLLLERFIKEVIHEIGHTFGLIHCHVPACVMRSSTYVEDIDLKKPHFCVNCRSDLLREI
jgi:archaemetzincin